MSLLQLYILLPGMFKMSVVNNLLSSIFLMKAVSKDLTTRKKKHKLNRFSLHIICSLEISSNNSMFVTIEMIISKFIKMQSKFEWTCFGYVNRNRILHALPSLTACSCRCLLE